MFLVGEIPVILPVISRVVGNLYQESEGICTGATARYGRVSKIGPQGPISKGTESSESFLHIGAIQLVANFGRTVNCYMCRQFAHMANSRGPFKECRHDHV